MVVPQGHIMLMVCFNAMDDTGDIMTLIADIMTLNLVVESFPIDTILRRIVITWVEAVGNVDPF